jgi:hypothetical protein
MYGFTVPLIIINLLFLQHHKKTNSLLINKKQIGKKEPCPLLVTQVQKTPFWFFV